MPSPEFIASVRANLEYWTERLKRAHDVDLRHLDSDWSNLRRAASFGSQLPETQAATLAMVMAGYRFVERHGYGREWLPWLERVGRFCPEHDLRLRAELLEQQGNLLRLEQQRARALDAHRAQEALALQMADTKELAYARFNLSEDYRTLRRYTEAEQAGLSALALFKQLGPMPAQVAAVLYTLGLIAQAVGDTATAAQRLSESIVLYRQLDWPTDLVRALKSLGSVQEAQGAPEAAAQAYHEALALLDQTASELDKVSVTLALGTLHYSQRHLAEAEAVFRSVDTIRLEQSGQLQLLALTANNLGNTLLAQGHWEAAEAELRRSLELWRQLDNPVELANTLGTLAETLGRQRRNALAAASYREAIDLLTGFPEDAWAQKLLEKFRAQAEQIVTAPA